MRSMIAAVVTAGLTFGWQAGAQEAETENTPEADITQPAESNVSQTNVVETTTEQPAEADVAEMESSTLPPAPKSRAVHFDLSAGISYWDGDLTDTIGGRAIDDNWVYYLDDPLSELKFPLGVAAVNVDASMNIRKALEVYGRALVSVTDPDDKMEDSDWDEGEKVVYSESDSDVSAWSADAGVRWWFHTSPCKKTGMTAGIAPALGYKKQSIDWDISNLDQWYPTYPNEPHDRVAGKTMTYDFDLDMLYAGGKAYLRHPRFSLTASAGISAYLNMQATDNHILRSKKNEADYDGNAWFAEGEGRFYLTRSLFLLGRVNYFYAKADGTQKQHFYAGEYLGWHGEIGGELETKQLTGTIGIGLEF
ncbi:MAG: omptin family outer membrane protease [Kiritimatiellae bacterium]|nr:omptin family outer membrane protease [Kiritimatiellia bacterium]MDD4735295.1 omptin family outer membrane protease [Kiritimatiellia bacterium]